MYVALLWSKMATLVKQKYKLNTRWTNKSFPVNWEMSFYFYHHSSAKGLPVVLKRTDPFIRSDEFKKIGRKGFNIKHVFNMLRVQLEPGKKY